ncbi:MULTISPECIES: cytidylyltransferase domain-containing protein [unclassified Thiocapsa]|uniref:cytidylyltransferase domain-containing protein n=1 Tax=unclassified Thiocapsa TaxID=2641286 RepID=UPI0035B486A7
MPAIAIIQARLSSSRLPGKVLKPLAGQPMIWHIVQRARACQRVDQVVVATSVEPSDDALADFRAQDDIPCHRGSLHNVLSRYLEVLDAHRHPYCVRITGDCPLIAPDFIDRQIQGLEAHGGDQTWLSAPAPALGGQGVHSTRSLKVVAERSTHPDDLEHVGSRYLAEHPEQFRIIGLHPPKALTDANRRVTVDEAADYEMMQHLYTALWQGEPIALDDALDWMARHPELAAHNQAVPQSAINQELAAKREAWARHVDLFCDWDDPSHRCRRVSPTEAELF